MTILSLDLSTKSSGWAIFENQELKEYGCLTESSTNLLKRIKNMTIKLEEIINTHSIDKIIAEEVRPDFGSGNLQTHRALMWLQGSVASMLCDHNLSLEYIYPSSWRAACGIKTGRGIRRETLKKADIEFVKNTYNIEVNDDEADAIGIGYSIIYSK